MKENNLCFQIMHNQSWSKEHKDHFWSVPIQGNWKWYLALCNCIVMFTIECSGFILILVLGEQDCKYFYSGIKYYKRWSVYNDVWRTVYQAGVWHHSDIGHLSACGILFLLLNCDSWCNFFFLFYHKQYIFLGLKTFRLCNQTFLYKILVQLFSSLLAIL